MGGLFGGVVLGGVGKGQIGTKKNNFRLTVASSAQELPRQNTSCSE